MLPVRKGGGKIGVVVGNKPDRLVLAFLSLWKRLAAPGRCVDHLPGRNRYRAFVGDFLELCWYEYYDGHSTGEMMTEMDRTTEAEIVLPPARLHICIRHKGQWHKLLWFNESPSGIFIGHFGNLRQTHFSYHQDGNTHMKGRKGKLITEPDVFPAIKDVGRAIQFGPSFHFRVSELETIERYTDLFTATAKAFQVYVQDFSAFTHLCTTQYLTASTDEPDTLESAYAFATVFGGVVLNLICTPLAHFPGHKLVVVVTGRHTKNNIRRDAS